MDQQVGLRYLWTMRPDACLACHVSVTSRWAQLPSPRTRTRTRTHARTHARARTPTTCMHARAHAHNTNVRALAGDDPAVDVLYDGHRMLRLQAQRVTSRNTHGTGCTLAAAIAAEMAKGASAVAAVQAAKGFVTEALQRSASLHIGQGPHGPLNHGCVTLSICVFHERSISSHPLHEC